MTSGVMNDPFMTPVGVPESGLEVREVLLAVLGPHAPRGVDMQGYMRAWLKSAPGAHGGVRVQVDIDPQTFL